MVCWNGVCHFHRHIRSEPLETGPERSDPDSPTEAQGLVERTKPAIAACGTRLSSFSLALSCRCEITTL
jgi:hypothetical protein